MNADTPEVAGGSGDIPPDVADVLVAVAQGGPFAFGADGSVFNNREGLLPPQSGGYYREYTVPTVGVPGRGVRRLVIGSGGEAYFTSDHYKSFQQIR